MLSWGAEGSWLVIESYPGALDGPPRPRGACLGRRAVAMAAGRGLRFFLTTRMMIMTMAATELRPRGR